MTDRIKGFIVTLDDDYRTDDVESILAAVRMVRGVAHVAPSVTDPGDHYARMRVASDIGADLLALYRKIVTP